MLSPGDVLSRVDSHLLRVLGEPFGRASVAFLGVPEIRILRFGPGADGIVSYVTLGTSGAPMSGATAVVEAAGPRAELTLSLRGVHNGVLRPLAVLASTPAAEGVVLAPGMSVDLGEPLWPGARFSSVLLDEPRGLVPDLSLGAGAAPVRFLPLVPLTAEEAAAKRVHGPEWLFELWHAQSIDLLDPERLAARLS